MRFLILIFSFLTFSAAAAKTFIVGVVDMQALYKEYPGTVRAQKKFDEFARERKRDLADSAEALQELQIELSSPKSVLSAQERKNKEKEFEEATQNYQNEENRFRNELAERNQEMMKKLTTRIKEIIVEMAKKYEIDLVMDRNDLVGVKVGMDMTTVVLRAFAELKPEETDLDSTP